MCLTHRNANIMYDKGILYFLCTVVKTVLEMLKESSSRLLCAAIHNRLDGEVALITGAGTRLGRAVAVEFAQMGCHLVLWDTDDQECRKTSALIRDMGGNVRYYTCDIIDRKWIYETAQKVRRDVGKVDILVNNILLINPGGSLTDVPDERVMETFHMNVLSQFWIIKAFFLYMTDCHSSGCIASVYDEEVPGLEPGSAIYEASKQAVIGFNEALRYELQRQGLNRIRSFSIFHSSPEYSPKLGCIPVGRKSLDGDTSCEKMAEHIARTVLNKRRRFSLIPNSVQKIIKTVKNIICDVIWYGFSPAFLCKMRTQYLSNKHLTLR